MLAHLEPAAARRVLEPGCGTGRLAQHLLAQDLPPDALYVGMDISRTMTRLARQRLSAFGDRALVVRIAGDPDYPVATASCDRFVAVYVLDLLPEKEIRAAIGEAWRVLRPGGRLGLVSLGHGCTAASRLVARAWSALARRHPEWVGGCRPIELRAFVAPPWEMLHLQRISAFGVPSECLVARRPQDPA